MKGSVEEPLVPAAAVAVPVPVADVALELVVAVGALLDVPDTVPLEFELPELGPEW